MPHLLASLEVAKKWQTKELALQLISSLTKTVPKKIQHEMVIIIPAVTPCMTDARPQVSAQGYTTMEDVCRICGTPWDPCPHVPVHLDGGPRLNTVPCSTICGLAWAQTRQLRSDGDFNICAPCICASLCIDWSTQRGMH